ncbi:MAG: response regulator [Sedimentisphaerales bacterium]|nr:response regulator [Sedimentisphaerales bacterium]
MENLKPILLIEDDRVDAMTVQRALKEIGASNHLIHITDHEQALEHLMSHSDEPPVLILMDLNTPKMNGKEFLQVINTQESLRDIPVVVMSSSNEQQDMTDTSRLGVVKYLVKSVDYTDFVESLRSVEYLWNASKSPA